MTDSKGNGHNAEHVAPAEIKTNCAINSIANPASMPYAVELLAATFARMKATPIAMSRFIDFLPYRLEPAGDGFAILRNDCYMTIGTPRSHRTRQDYESLKVPEAGIDRSLLLNGDYFYHRSTGPFMGRPHHCREYLFRLWWTFRKLRLPPPMPFDQMLMEAAKALPKQYPMAEVVRYCHAI
jgi:hypothetical protein